MYQYSLTYYIEIFSNSIDKSDKSSDLQVRLRKLKEYFLYSLYSNICRSLFEKDKLLLSFLLCVRIQEFKELVRNEDYRFLITGGLQMDEELPEKPIFDWITDKMWGEICRLSKLEGFHTLIDSFNDQTEDWKKIYDSTEPHKVPLPPIIRDQMSNF